MSSAPHEVLENAGKNVVNQSYKKKILDRDFDSYYDDDVKKKLKGKKKGEKQRIYRG